MADLFTTIETPSAKYEQPLGLYVIQLSLLWASETPC